MKMFLSLYLCVRCSYMVLLKALQQYETPLGVMSLRPLLHFRLSHIS